MPPQLEDDVPPQLEAMELLEVGPRGCAQVHTISTDGATAKEELEVQGGKHHRLGDGPRSS